MYRIIMISLCSLGITLATGDMAGCTKQQAIDVTNVLVDVAAGVCKDAPQFVPQGTSEGTVVGLFCPLVSDPTQLVPVLVSAAGWNAIKAEAAAKAARQAK